MCRVWLCYNKRNKEKQMDLLLYKQFHKFMFMKNNILNIKKFCCFVKFDLINLYAPDKVIYLYLLNFMLVGADTILYFRYKNRI